VEYALEFAIRESMRTVSCPCELNVRDAERATQRLRAWAFMRDVPTGSLAFLRLPGPLVAFAHLEIRAEVMPHPETGLSLDRVLAGPVIHVSGVRLDEAWPLTRALHYEFGAECGIAGPAEFHANGGRFSEGTLVLPVHRLPAQRPGTVALPGAGDDTR
jgi:hypothetical protein